MTLLITVLVSVLGLNTVLADEMDFRKEYSAFGQTPKASLRPIAEKLVKVSLKDFELEAENVEQAYRRIREALKATDYPNGLSLIMKNPDDKNYKSAIKIPKATRTLGEVINLLCVQANLVWDFSSSKLTLTPKAEQ